MCKCEHDDLLRNIGTGLIFHMRIWWLSDEMLMFKDSIWARYLQWHIRSTLYFCLCLKYYFINMDDLSCLTATALGNLSLTGWWCASRNEMGNVDFTLFGERTLLQTINITFNFQPSCCCCSLTGELGNNKLTLKKRQNSSGVKKTERDRMIVEF